MKKFVNSVDTMLAESLDGFAAAHADLVVLGPERKFVRRRSPNLNKVALISGGGSGHEPLLRRIARAAPQVCLVPPELAQDPGKPVRPAQTQRAWPVRSAGERV